MYQLLLTRRYLTSKVMPLLAALAVALCTALVLTVWSVMGGFLSTFMASGRTLTGDIVIEWPNAGFPHYDDLIARLEKNSLVAAAAPAIQTFGLIVLPDGRRETVVVRGIEGKSFSRVTDFEKTLWWRPLSKPNPRDKDGEDPRLTVGELMEKCLANGKSLTRPDPVTGQPMPAVVPGIQVADFSRRDGERGIYIPKVVLKPGADGKARPLDIFLPRDGYVTLHVAPTDSSGNVIQMSSGRFPVANEFQSGIFEVDNNTVFVELGELQRMLQMQEADRIARSDDEPYRIEIDPVTREERLVSNTTVIGKDPARVTHVVVRGVEDTIDPAALDRLYKAVEGVYDGFYNAHPKEVPAGIQINTWIDLNFTLISAIKKEISLVLFLFILISFVSVFLVLSIFWSMISEKTKDIGILRAMGAGQAGVAGLWIAYGLVLGLVGALLGIGLAYLIVLNINPIHEWLGRALGITIWDPRVYYFTTIPSKVETTQAIIVFAGGVLSAGVGALIPAARAARMDPVRALRFE